MVTRQHSLGASFFGPTSTRLRARWPQVALWRSHSRWADAASGPTESGPAAALAEERQRQDGSASVVIVASPPPMLPALQPLPAPGALQRGGSSSVDIAARSSTRPLFPGQPRTGPRTSCPHCGGTGSVVGPSGPAPCTSCQPWRRRPDYQPGQVLLSPKDLDWSPLEQATCSNTLGPQPQPAGELQQPAAGLAGTAAAAAAAAVSASAAEPQSRRGGTMTEERREAIRRGALRKGPHSAEHRRNIARAMREAHAKDPSLRQATKGAQKTCSYCGGKGHTLRACPQRLADLTARGAELPPSRKRQRKAKPGVENLSEERRRMLSQVLREAHANNPDLRFVGKGKQKSCAYCGAKGHTRRGCPQRKADEAAALQAASGNGNGRTPALLSLGGRRTFTCGHCGRQGHSRLTCPLLKSEAEAAATQELQPGMALSGWSTSTCSLCGKPGHRRITCPELKAAAGASQPQEEGEQQAATEELTVGGNGGAPTVGKALPPAAELTLAAVPQADVQHAAPAAEPVLAAAVAEPGCVAGEPAASGAAATAARASPEAPVVTNGAALQAMSRSEEAARSSTPPQPQTTRAAQQQAQQQAAQAQALQLPASSAPFAATEQRASPASSPPPSSSKTQAQAKAQARPPLPGEAPADLGPSPSFDVASLGMASVSYDDAGLRTRELGSSGMLLDPDGGLVFPLPSRQADCVKQASQAVLRAWEDGIRWQCLELPLPLNNVPAEGGWPGGIRQQYRVALPILEGLLLRLKQYEGLQGRITAEWLDKADCVGAWQSERLAAVLFPTADTLPAVRRIENALSGQRLMLVVNPQWQVEGQVISDFGFGQARRRAEQFIKIFEDIYCLRRARVRGEEVRILKCYPGTWQVYYIESDEKEPLLLACEEAKPSYQRLEQLIQPILNRKQSWLQQLAAAMGLVGSGGGDAAQAPPLPGPHRSEPMPAREPAGTPEPERVAAAARAMSRPPRPAPAQALQPPRLQQPRGGEADAPSRPRAAASREGGSLERSGRASRGPSGLGSAVTAAAAEGEGKRYRGHQEGGAVATGDGGAHQGENGVASEQQEWDIITGELVTRARDYRLEPVQEMAKWVFGSQGECGSRG